MWQLILFICGFVESLFHLRQILRWLDRFGPQRSDSVLSPLDWPADHDPDNPTGDTS